MSESSNKSISYLAVFVAILALLVSLYEGYEIRKHNRLSLRPLIDSKTFVKEDDYFRVEIKNAGLGPAVFKSFTITANGKNVENWNEAMREIGITQFSRLNTLNENEVFQREETVTLVKIDTVMANYNIGFILRYESLYGEKFILKENF